MNFKTLLIPALSAALFLGSCTDDAPPPPDMQPVVKPDIEFYGLSNNNQLLKINAKAPETVISTTLITGLTTGDKIIAIDFRPATGQLYGLGNSSRLYTINLMTGAATAVGAAPFTPAIGGTLAGFDFNPTVDRIRLVTSTGTNLRLHPETGALAATDGPINPGSPSIVAVAYTNSVAGAATTTLYDIDIVSQKLYKQDPPNNGTLVEVGSLGVVTSNEGGFDISPDNMVALATFTISMVNTLHQVDLNTGKASKLGDLSVPLIGLAIPTKPVAYAIDNSNNNLLIFNPMNSEAPISKTITGLQTAETILGLDMRPATGQLYALGSSSRIYTINMSSGAAAVVGSMLTTPLVGTSFGFDFNPTVDRIRVVSNTGQNLRLHPETAVVASVDGPLNPGTPAVSGAAYTNSFAGATTTTLFDIDATLDKLYRQDPPNNGTLVEIGNLGVNVETANGFDIGGTSNQGYALLTVGSTTKLYSINVTSGAATAGREFPGTVRAFALGLGF